MIKKIKKSYKKIRSEYRKSRMSLPVFIYWSVRSSWSEFKRKHGLVKKDDYVTRYWARERKRRGIKDRPAASPAEQAAISSLLREIHVLLKQQNEARGWK